MRGEYHEAENYYRKSLNIAEKLRDEQGIAASLHNLGIIQQDQGNYTEAERYYKESLELKKRPERKQETI